MYRPTRQDQPEARALAAPAAEKWRDKAKCRTMDPRQFELDALHISQESRARLAAAACRGCPVKSACALDAIEHGDAYTVRAGISLLPLISPKHTKREARARNRRALELIAARYA